MGDIGHFNKVSVRLSDINIITFDIYMEVDRQKKDAGYGRHRKGDRRMRVEGIGAGAAPALKTGTQAVDATSRSLQKQIENAQKQMQELAKNDQMSPEDKMKKRQELQKQITDLEQQLRQHALELQRKQAEEARKKREQEEQERSAGRQKEQEQKGVMSKDSMNAMLSADSAVRQADANGTIVTRMEGEKRVLAGEIRQDKARGINTAKQEEKLSDMEERIRDVTGTQIKTLAEAGKKLQDTSKKEAEDRAKEAGKAEKDEKTGREEDMTYGISEGAEEDDAKNAAELAQKMKKEQMPGQLIDERL